MTTPKFKIGDKVRVVRRIASFAGGWQNSWSSPEMDREVGTGRVFTVTEVRASGVYFSGSYYGWPEAALELITITDPKALKVGDVVRFKATHDDQRARRDCYPTTGEYSTFTVTRADGTWLSLDGHRYNHYRRRFDLVKAAPEPVILGTRLMKLILDEAAPAPKAVPLQSHIVVLKNSKGMLKPATTPFVHVTKASADAEAERLAKQHPGQTFVVFTSNAEAVAAEPAVTVTKHAAA